VFAGAARFVFWACAWSIRISARLDVVLSALNDFDNLPGCGPVGNQIAAEK
jgi:hypothetical protein